MINILNTKIKFHWSWGIFCVLTSLFLQPSISLDFLIAFIINAFLLTLTILGHEFAHVISARALGLRAEEIFISPLVGGAKILVPPLGFKDKDSVMISMAGPAFTLALGLILCLFLLVDFEGMVSTRTAFEFGASLNILLFLANIIPLPPLDGGIAHDSLMRILKVDKVKSVRIAKTFCFLGGSGLITVGLSMRRPEIIFLGLVFFAAMFMPRDKKLKVF